MFHVEKISGKGCVNCISQHGACLADKKRRWSALGKSAVITHKVSIVMRFVLGNVG